MKGKAGKIPKARWVPFQPEAKIRTGNISYKAIRSALAGGLVSYILLSLCWSLPIGTGRGADCAAAVPTAGERYRRGGALRREGAKTALETPKKRSFICFLQIIQLSLPQLFEVVNIGATHGKQNRRQVVTLSYYKPCKSLKSILLHRFSSKL